MCKIPLENIKQFSRIREIYAKMSPKYPKMALREGEHDTKNIFQCSDHQGYAKNTCTKFHEKILIGSEVLEKHSPK